MHEERTTTILDNYSFAESARLAASSFWPEKQILETIQGTQWELRRTTTRDTNKQSVEVFELRNLTTETTCHFVCSSDKSAVHVLMFRVSPDAESRYFVARRNFSELLSIFWQCGFQAVRGDALTNVEKNPLARSREWRNSREIRDGDRIQKLTLFWLRLGAVVWDGALTFFAPNHLTRVRAVGAMYGVNPFKYLSPSNSVYCRELAERLRSEFSPV
jgi:hypothetical protein